MSKLTVLQRKLLLSSSYLFVTKFCREDFFRSVFVQLPVSSFIAVLVRCIGRDEIRGNKSYEGWQKAIVSAKLVFK